VLWGRFPHGAPARFEHATFWFVAGLNLVYALKVLQKGKGRDRPFAVPLGTEKQGKADAQEGRIARRSWIGKK
jgi:hypothetical protein